MSNWMFEKLLPHRGHRIVCVSYGDWDDPADVCIECEDCGCVLVSAEDFDDTINTYEYEELSSDAKAKVGEWFLRDPMRSQLLTNDFVQWAKNILPASDLSVQWSLCSCQGDGVNLYGTLRLGDVMRWIGNEGHFTYQEWKRIAYYLKQTGIDAHIPCNHRYCYCIADQIDFASEWIDDLQWQLIEDIDEDLINRFQDKYVVPAIQKLCKEMEEYGYRFLYEIDTEELTETCAANEWRFTSNGDFVA